VTAANAARLKCDTDETAAAGSCALNNSEATLEEAIAKLELAKIAAATAL
jgi:hypothetical protein